MPLSQEWSRAIALFDDPNLVSCAGLVPVLALALALAEQTGLLELLRDGVRLGQTRVGSAGVNPAGKLTSVVAGDVRRGAQHR